MRAVLRVEVRKLLRSPVGWITSAALLGGGFALLSGVSFAIRSGNQDLITKAGQWGTTDWHGLIGSAQQIMGAGGLLACSVLLAWLFAREFSDRTINGLFALPISRAELATAKLLVYSGWALFIAAALPLGVLLLGLALGYGPPELAWLDLGRLVALALGTAVVALPVAWVATASRSLLAGIGAGIALMVLGQRVDRWRRVDSHRRPQSLRARPWLGRAGPVTARTGLRSCWSDRLPFQLAATSIEPVIRQDSG